MEIEMEKMRFEKMELSLVNVFSSRGRIKIIDLLARNSEMNISEIINRTGLNHRTCKAHLEQLMKIGFVQEKKFSRIRIYRFWCRRSFCRR